MRFGYVGNSPLNAVDPSGEVTLNQVMMGVSVLAIIGSIEIDTRYRQLPSTRRRATASSVIQIAKLQTLDMAIAGFVHKIKTWFPGVSPTVVQSMWMKAHEAIAEGIPIRDETKEPCGEGAPMAMFQQLGTSTGLINRVYMCDTSLLDLPLARPDRPGGTTAVSTYIHEVFHFDSYFGRGNSDDHGGGGRLGQTRSRAQSYANINNPYAFEYQLLDYLYGPLP